MREAYILRLLKHLNPWQSEIIHFDSDIYFSALLDEIRLAQYRIDFECYIFSNDSIGKRVCQELINASKRGVKVRLIVDGLGSQDWVLQNHNCVKRSGIGLKIYHPLPWQLSLYTEVSVVKGFIARFMYLIARINKRDHRKLYIIDGKKAWTGSINLSANHLASTNRDDNWFDCGVEVTGDCVEGLLDSFENIWQSNKRRVFAASELPFRTNDNFIRRQKKNYELIRLIRSCSERIWIISAYLAPSRQVVFSLKRAKRNGVDVKLMISSRSDVIFFPLVSSVYYQELISAGVEIYEYEEKIIHAKTIIFDDLISLGSSNLNHRSFLHDLELDLFLRDKNSLKLMSEKFSQLVKKSVRITFDSLRVQSWYKRILGKLVWRLRYWL